MLIVIYKKIFPFLLERFLFYLVFFKLLKSSNYNEELCYNGNTYYLHVDVINYYYKTRIEYEEDESLYFSKKLSYNNKEGYVEITKKDEQYLVSIYYNYHM